MFGQSSTKLTTAMPISIKEVRRNLTAFALEYADAKDERQEAQEFQIEFYRCFGINQRKARAFEKRVENSRNTTGYIDGYVPGKLLTEMKSRGVSLDRAHEQAHDYAAYMKGEEIPPYILTCNFARFRLYSLDDGSVRECGLEELADRAEWFMFLTDNPSKQIVEESPVNKQAAYAIAALHEKLIQSGFVGHDLEVFLTRLLFCLFADDTGIFGEKQQFARMLAATSKDGTTVKGDLQTLFEDVLNIPEEKRQKTLSEEMLAFAYVNGDLFKERTRLPVFDGPMREALLACSTDIDWSLISPAIFGAMFQSVLEDAEADTNSKRKASRRELGAHFTSERNILRAINPLFMDNLRAEFEAAKKKRDGKKSLTAFYDKLPTITIFDPACGCGNFLVVAYRELRELEHEVIAAIWGERGPELLEINTRIRVNVSQFYGIEIDEAAAHIARVAMYITDEQMNHAAEQRFGKSRPTVPITSTPHIHCGNALQIDWNDVLPAKQCSYIVGNPPFVGAKLMSDEQREDVAAVFKPLKNGGLLDYVAAWYVKAATYIQGTEIPVAFVSTNSITQGEQVGVLWSWMLAQGVKIHFAHRTFQWSNEGRGVAAVHCIIIGFGLQDTDQHWLFDYETPKAQPIQLSVHRINPYLVEAADALLTNRSKPICAVPEIGIGNKPIDGGYYLFTDAEKAEFLQKEPKAEKWFRRWLGADEFINGWYRWCLWLGNCPPAELRQMPEAMKRVEAVKQQRLASKSVPTQKLAATPTRFHVENLPDTEYLLLPRVSSEKRLYIPFGFIEAKTMTSDSALISSNATRYHFGVISSTMHMAWTRTVCGRLESRYRYSAGIVYNNFPWPTPSEKQRTAIEVAAQAVLDARNKFTDSTLADLYDPTAMPPELTKAHQALDKAVDAAYGKKSFACEAERVAFLFERYQELVGASPQDELLAEAEGDEETPKPKRQSRKKQ